MRYRILGSLRVVDGNGVAAEVRGAKIRALLGILLSAAPREVGFERLADLLWSGAPPPGAPNTLQAHVARLRRIVEPGRAPREVGQVLATSATGYAISLREGDLDARIFASLVDQAMCVDDPDVRFATLGRALDLWDGPPFAEYAGASWALAEATRLEELRADALDHWFSAGLACGRHHELMSEMEVACDAAPHREHRVALAMTALYRCDRQVEALGLYHRVVGQLRSERGLEPSRALRDLEHNILVHDPALDWQRERPAPSPVATTSRAFVGRDDELRTLTEAWRVACAGTPQCVLIGGEPGIGKTELAAEFARRIAAEGGVTLWGRACEATGRPFQVLVDALGAFGHADDLSAERHELFESVTATIRSQCRERPLLLVIDDAQWADDPSLLFLRHLRRRVAPAALLVVVTYRDTDASAERVMGLFDARECEQVSLAGLDEPAVAELVSVHRGRAPSTELVGALCARTGGNPFFVESLLAEIGSDALAGADADVTRIVDSAVPGRARQLIAGRIERLAPDTVTALGVAAVLGGELEVGLIRECLGVDDGDVEVALEQAERVRLLVPSPARPGHYEFPHALIREAVLGTVSSARRSNLHRAAARALERSGSLYRRTHAAELAHHYERAGDQHSLRRAIECRRAASAHAMDVLAYESAVAHTEAALALLTRAEDATVAEHVDLLETLGRARYLTGDVSGSKDAFLRAVDLARSLAESERFARVAVGASGLGVTMLWSDYGVANEPVVALLREALARTPEGDSALRARLLARVAEELHPSGDRAQIDFDATDAVTMAERVGDPGVLAEALHARLRTIWRPDTLEERTAISLAMREAADRSGDASLRAVAHGRLATQYLEHGTIHRAERAIERLGEMAERTNNPLHRMWFLGMRSCMALFRGEFDAVELGIGEAAAVAPELFPTVQAFAGVLCVLRVEQGRTAEMVDAGRIFVDSLPHVAAWRAGLSVLLAESGRLDEAREEAERVAANDFSAVPRDQDWMFCMGVLGETISVLDDAGLAAALWGQLSGFVDRFVVLGDGYAVWTCVERTLGVLARAMRKLDVAEEHLRGSVVAHERIKAPPLLARSQYELARVLALKGDGREAGELAASARATAVRLGQAGLIASLDRFARDNID